MSKRRTFSREFKLEAVRKVIIHAMSTAEVARDLGIRDNQIYNWKKQFDADGTLDELGGKDVSTENELLIFEFLFEHEVSIRFVD